MLKKMMLIGVSACFVAVAAYAGGLQLTDDPADVRILPHRAQRQIQPDSIDRSALMKELPFSEWGIRETAADSLWRMGAKAVPALIETLRDPDPYVRVLAARALANIGPAAEPAVPALLIAMDDPEPAVRQHAVRALGQIGPAAAVAIPDLIDRLQGPRR